MNGDELLHRLAAATWFDSCGDLGLPPLEEALRYTHAQSEGASFATSFGAAVYRERDGGTMSVFWTDWVANDWVQRVADLEEAKRFLYELCRVVDLGEDMTDAWRDPRAPQIAL